jgi:hypothetical protein
MMARTWGNAPSGLDSLLDLRLAFNSTPISELVGGNAIQFLLHHGQGSLTTKFVPLDVKNDTLLDAMLVLGLMRHLFFFSDC